MEYRSIKVVPHEELFKEAKRTVAFIQFVASELDRYGMDPEDAQYFSDVLGMQSQLLSISEHINLRKEIADTFLSLVYKRLIKTWQSLDS